MKPLTKAQKRIILRAGRPGFNFQVTNTDGRTEPAVNHLIAMKLVESRPHGPRLHLLGAAGEVIGQYQPHMRFLTEEGKLVLQQLQKERGQS